VEPAQDDKAEDPPDWTLYLLVSARLERTYVGIALDPERRLEQHNGDAPGGARATRAGRPWDLARTWGPFPDRAAAQRAEAALKRLKGRARLTWSAGDPDQAGA
jgi:structure-specific endonuclease subunit SLX1